MQRNEHETEPETQKHNNTHIHAGKVPQIPTESTHDILQNWYQIRVTHPLYTQGFPLAQELLTVKHLIYTLAH